MASSIECAPASPHLDPQTLLPPIAGFWARLGAFLIDVVILGVASHTIAWFTADFWYQTGPYGRFFGLVVLLGYFGLMNSAIGGGQTFGKRVLVIAVTGPAGRPIGVGRSMARTAIWVFPYIMNGWALPQLSIPVVASLVSILAGALGSAVLYTMIFNRGSRQGIHDMLCGTYVVYLNGAPALPVYPRAARIHWIASAGLAAFSLVMVSIIVPRWFASALPRAPFAAMMELGRALQQDERFFSAGVSDQILTVSGRGSTRILIIDAWYKGQPSQEEKPGLANEIARVVLSRYPNIDGYNTIAIRITSGFDLGIASIRRFDRFGYPPAQWRQRLSPSSR